MYNYFMYGMFPYIPNDKFFQPPLLYDIMNSIANFGKDTHTKIKNLPLATHDQIFDFDYPLSNKVNKTDFEVMILKKFIKRRIGQETFTAFQLALDSKLNEIMPYYNKIFDSFIDWNLFNDGESGTKTSTNNIEKENTIEKENSLTSETETDNRYSKLPQNEIQNVKDGTYMTDYNLGKSVSEGTNTENSSENGAENTTYNENYTKNNSNKIDTYLKFIEDRNKIMTLIYEDLDELFYGITNTN